MKHFICLAIISFLFMCPACARGQDLSRYDLSTDEGVTAARKAIGGKKIDEYSKGCIRRSPELSKIVVVGSFAHDRGCDFQGVFLGSRYFEENDAATSKSALNFMGWQTARQEQRERLARLWVEKGLLAFLTVLVQRDEAFPDHPFQPPQAVSRESGEIIVTLWIREPPGMRRERVSQLLEYRFSKDGALAGRTMLENLVR
jgi:hypothetical protein